MSMSKYGTQYDVHKHTEEASVHMYMSCTLCVAHSLRCVCVCVCVHLWYETMGIHVTLISSSNFDVEGV